MKLKFKADTNPNNSNCKNIHVSDLNDHNTTDMYYQQWFSVNNWYISTQAKYEKTELLICEHVMFYHNQCTS